MEAPTSILPRWVTTKLLLGPCCCRLWLPICIPSRDAVEGRAGRDNFALQCGRWFQEGKRHAAETSTTQRPECLSARSLFGGL